MTEGSEFPAPAELIALLPPRPRCPFKPFLLCWGRSMLNREAR